MPSIKRDGATVVYDVIGTGPTVILGHSLFCTRGMWDGVLDRLKGEFRFINVELRGHGESTAPKPFSLDDLADDWLQILDKESIESAALCGLSTGGMTAMRVALRAPERLRGLALLDTSASCDPMIQELKNRALAFGYVRFGILPTGELLKAMFAPQTQLHRPELTDPFVEQVRTFDRQQLGHAMTAIFTRSDLDLSSVRLPTLVICGEHDAALPMHHARHIAHTIPGARFEMIAEAGHLSAQEKPEQVANLLRPFLRTCFGTSPQATVDP